MHWRALTREHLSSFNLLNEILIARVARPEHFLQYLALPILFFPLVLAPLLLHGSLAGVGLEIARRIVEIGLLVLQKVRYALLFGDFKLLKGHARHIVFGIGLAILFLGL